MKRHRAVVDTNVLYSGLYSQSGASFQILRLIDRGRLVPQLSTTLLFEYEDVLTRNQHELKLSDRAVNDVLDGFCLRGECRKVHFLWRPQLSDPKDDHVLELAVAASGVDIVTHNLRDFGNASPFGIRIITPAQLLGELK
ncbi:MAG: putative toxin-antitoxin system toxin component, PIN family [Kiritimatiellia bacterium]|jgi:putative PIN family toxin of toxin-antitoxin system|nr:putative toxin-antitoxin system toxin component, PIN family [Kiritimatiellia bacterium]MDP6809250.1 putative toxin-antitoxin system toxin component, PIN family [Kiritimatiellia bacterium]MDP7022989.1 putative toxin-antitoxin system toxin component, PIN family [Kiritimatiellia bacterium]